MVPAVAAQATINCAVPPATYPPASTDTGGAGTNACKCYMNACLDVTAMGTSIQVTTTNGPVIGRSSGGVNRFMGVPIAADSTGPNRFKAPQPVSWASTAPVNALTEKQCPHGGYPIAGTEDCLSLDIWAPTAAASNAAGYPVSFYVHGGGFTRQDPSFAMLASGMNQAAYNFANLPNTGKTVAILSHYRMGALGWMAHPGMAGSTLTGFPGTNPGSGNWGMMDTLHGMAWIQGNAQAFNGDATRVTVYGESAGAAHVTMLIASPLTVGLARTFIAESPYITYGAATFSLQARMEMSTLWSMRAGCTTTADLASTVVVGSTSVALTEAACLRATNIVLLIDDVGFGGSAAAATGGLAASDTPRATWESKYGAGSAEVFMYNDIHCWPVIDGYTMTQAPLEAYAAGTNAAATIVIGHNADEYGTFCFWPYISAPASYYCGQSPDMYDEAWVFALYYLDSTASVAEIVAATFAAFTGTKMAQLRAGLYYSDIVDTLIAKTIQMGTDAWFANGNQQIIEALLIAPGRPVGNVYHYLYAHDADSVHVPYLGACHGCELTFVLGFYTASVSYLSLTAPASSGFGTIAVTAADNTVGAAMNGYWAAMFHTANPNTVGSGLPHWSPMSVTDKQTMVFQGLFPQGALMNPCVRLTGCRTESAKDWRMTKKVFWQSAPANLAYSYLPEPTCTSAPAGSYSHFAAERIGYNCSYLPCCTYGTTTGRRSLLFGAPSAAAATGSCDPIC